MKQRIKKYLEYRIFITSDTRIGTRERCYTAFVPLLGIATSGDTIENALANAKGLIVFHLESLRKEKKSLPFEKSVEEFVTTARIAIPA